MNYEVFRNLVKRIIAMEIEQVIEVEFYKSRGNFNARIVTVENDPYIIRGNPTTGGITVLWASGHQAMIPSERVSALIVSRF